MPPKTIYHISGIISIKRWRILLVEMKKNFLWKSTIINSEEILGWIFLRNTLEGKNSLARKKFWSMLILSKKKSSELFILRVKTIFLMKKTRIFTLKKSTEIKFLIWKFKLIFLKVRNRAKNLEGKIERSIWNKKKREEKFFLGMSKIQHWKIFFLTKRFNQN